jgi:hypothetical protein
MQWVTECMVRACSGGLQSMQWVTECMVRACSGGLQFAAKAVGSSEGTVQCVALKGKIQCVTLEVMILDRSNGMLLDRSS